MRQRDPLAIPRAPFAALGSVLGITAVWWAAALWPLPTDAPAWAALARAACFGTGASGLPDTAGWLALVLQPAVMLAVVLAVWGHALGTGIRALSRSAAGRAALAALSLALLTGAGLAAWRVNNASGAAAAAFLPGGVGRVDRPAPELRLVSQDGPFDLSFLRGRPVLVTFAFAHCRTVCPLVVREALAAREAAKEPTAVVVVTLDPRRDTPSRLSSIASRWRLGRDAWMVSGPVDEVNRTLDAWGVARSRDERTGDLVHAPLTYVVDGRGIVTHRTRGSAVALSAILRS